MARRKRTREPLDNVPQTARLRAPRRLCARPPPRVVCASSFSGERSRSSPPAKHFSTNQYHYFMIWCIGSGPGDLGYLTQRGKELIETADVVAGFTSVVDLVRPLVRAECVVTMGYKDQVEKLREVAALHHQGLKCAVVFMGDIHFSGFQFLERVERACGHRVETIAGISSAQILASRGRVSFDETTFVTFHRRGDLAPFKEHLLHVLEDGRNAIVIPRPWDFMPKDIAAFLLSRGIAPAHS